MNARSITETRFGLLKAGQGPENTIFWEGSYEAGDDMVIVYIQSGNGGISPETLQMAEEVVLTAESFVLKAREHILSAFTADPAKYLEEEEHRYLEADAAQLPLEMPELIFYDGDEEWMLRFAAGVFAICDPFGIAVSFRNKEILRLEDLSDSEEIDQ
ncbi:hypothetical protein [Chitinophaga sp. Cy-1792]|uniref:hypothetical protein n=1 Tax=Chitinophaga sp. Cy-1792 TaxID=2608339 RepID=UPI00141D77D2|nr:hypothetical protein [Chitinophaga sp. Cy-1792]NIG56406.1 hypothetical protein [Chitinophaga sp. Cy-1792]